MLFKFKKLDRTEIAVNVQNVESMKWDKRLNLGFVTMTSGARHPINATDFEMLERFISRIPSAV